MSTPNEKNAQARDALFADLEESQDRLNRIHDARALLNRIEDETQAHIADIQRSLGAIVLDDHR